MFSGRKIFPFTSSSQSGAGPEVAQLRKKLRRNRNRLNRKDEELVRLRRELVQAQTSVLRDSVPKFFLVGQAKSGTSWLMRLLHSHPEILCHGEGKLFGKDSPRTLHGALARSELFQSWLPRNPWTWRENDPKLEDILAACVDYLMDEKLAKNGRAKIVGDKTPLTSTEIVNEIAALLPDSKVIHIIRDGRDVAISRMHHLWNRATGEGGKYELTPEERSKRDRYREDPEAFLRCGESIFTEERLRETAADWTEKVGATYRDGPALLGDRYAEVRYEGLLQRPVEIARELMAFLDVNSSEEVAAGCVEAVSFQRLSKRTSGEDPTSFYRKGVSGEWEGVFTGEDRQTFKQVAGDLLIELGYAKDAD
jgi:hypothetical protein